MGLIDMIDKLIVEHGSSVVMEKHVALYKDQLVLIREKVVELEKRLSNAQRENDELKKKFPRQPIPEEQYAEESGALFKRLASGGYSDCPMCPRCHSAMSSIGGPLPYTCGNPACRQEAGFGKNKLQAVMSRLPTNA